MFLNMLVDTKDTMWSITDDITGKDFNKEHQIKVSIAFSDKNTGSKYYANLDIGPEGFLKLSGILSNKPRWSKQVKNTAEQEAETGRKFSYVPANATSIIASLVETEVTQ